MKTVVAIAVFGFLAFGAQAQLGKVVVVDLVWGTILTSGTATIGYFAGRVIGL